MGWRNLFRRSRPPPLDGPEHLRASIPIARPSAYPLVPAPSDAIDEEVTSLWLAYQRRHEAASWSTFVTHLAAENARLDERLDELRTRLAENRDHRTFVP